MSKITAYAKAIVALAGTLLMIWNQYSPGFIGLLPPSWSPAITAIIGVLTVIATYGVPNTTTDPLVAASQSVSLKTGRHEAT